MQAPPEGAISLETVLSFVDLATDALSGAREEIDALNVYPVPDGDTGTNMFLTVSAARDAIRGAAAEDPADLATGLAALARGALLGARGNSGVILSQMLGAISERLAQGPPGPGREDAGSDPAGETGRGASPKARMMAEAMRLATAASYDAVGEPAEGTMLTVAAAASAAAQEAIESDGARTRDVLAAAAAAAREALGRTPEQLQVLAEAGVVDAGGRGLCVVLDAAETVLTGRRPPESPATPRIPRPVIATPRDDLRADGPAYEVMYLLDADDEAVPPLREALAPLGDSLVVVGGHGLWNVHVHVDDVGAAIEAGLEAGRPHRVRVTHFAEQVARATARRREQHAPTGRRLVAVSAGVGLAGLFSGVGAVVVPGGPGQRPSTADLLAAITGSGAAEVVVLPNDSDSMRVAEIAARTAEEDGRVRVEVIPTVAQVQGLAAAAVHEPGRGFDADVREMTATARHARHGAVTVAARQAMTMAGPCEVGDVLGVLDGDFVAVGSDLVDVACDVLDRLLGGGGELVTLVTGDEVDADLAARCTAWVEQHHPHVDVAVHDGGQPRYPLLVGVE